MFVEISLILLALIFGILILFINVMPIYKAILRKPVLFKFLSSEGDDCIYLTIDDVPYHEGECAILKIIEILRREQCCATLFVIGEYLKDASTETIKYIQEAIRDKVIVLANHDMTERKHWRLDLESLR